jgi:hypothetical protein
MLLDSFSTTFFLYQNSLIQDLDNVILLIAAIKLLVWQMTWVTPHIARRVPKSIHLWMLARYVDLSVFLL